MLYSTITFFYSPTFLLVVGKTKGCVSVWGCVCVCECVGGGVSVWEGGGECVCGCVSLCVGVCGSQFVSGIYLRYNWQRSAGITELFNFLANFAKIVKRIVFDLRTKNYLAGAYCLQCNETTFSRKMETLVLWHLPKMNQSFQF